MYFSCLELACVAPATGGRLSKGPWRWRSRRDGTLSSVTNSNGIGSGMYVSIRSVYHLCGTVILVLCQWRNFIRRCRQWCRQFPCQDSLGISDKSCLVGSTTIRQSGLYHNGKFVTGDNSIVLLFYQYLIADICNATHSPTKEQHDTADSDTWWGTLCR